MYTLIELMYAETRKMYAIIHKEKKSKAKKRKRKQRRRKQIPMRQKPHRRCLLLRITLEFLSMQKAVLGR